MTAISEQSNRNEQALAHPLFDQYIPPLEGVDKKQFEGIREIDFVLKNAEALPPAVAVFLATQIALFNNEQGRLVDNGDDHYVEHLVDPDNTTLQQETYQSVGFSIREFIREHIGPSGTLAEVYPAMGGICIADQRMRLYPDTDQTTIHALKIDGNIGTETGHLTKLHGAVPEEVRTANRVKFRDDVIDSGVTAGKVAIERLEGEDREEAEALLAEIDRLRKEGKSFDDPALKALYMKEAVLFKKANVLLDPLYWKNDPLFEGLQALCKENPEGHWEMEQKFILGQARPLDEVREYPALFEEGYVGAIRIPETSWIGGGAIYDRANNRYRGMLDIGTPIHAVDPENGRIFGFAQYLPEDIRAQLLAACGETNAMARLYDQSMTLTRVKTEIGADDMIVRAFAAYLAQNWDKELFAQYVAH